jgi:hypothetical protein
MTGFIVSIFSFRNRVSPKEAFEGLEPGEGKLSRPVLRGLGSREAAWPLDSNPDDSGRSVATSRLLSSDWSVAAEAFVGINPQ